jgi:hypothetical protein
MFSSDCGGLGSGCYGLRYRFGNPCGFIAHCYHNFQTFGTPFSVLILPTMAPRQCCGSPRSPHPSHPSRNSPPSPLFFKREGRYEYSFYYCSPSLIHLERGNKKGVSKTPHPSRNLKCEND